MVILVINLKFDQLQIPWGRQKNYVQFIFKQLFVGNIVLQLFWQTID